MKNIYLVGFMGSGKSTVGKLLAEDLGMRFVDIDKEVESSEGMSIKDIFKNLGEEYFRDAEKKKLKEYIEKTGFVVSTGGGLGADRQMMELMKASGTVVWIKAEIGTILSRCGNDEERPLLKLPPEKLMELFEKRNQIYSMADIHISSEDKTPFQISLEVIRRLKR